jgi:hypothetical protein
MEKDRSLDRLLMEIGEILTLIQKSKGRVHHVDEWVEKNLDYIEYTIRTLIQYNKENLQKANVTPEQLTQEALASPNTSPREKQLLQRAQEIEEDAILIQSAIAKGLENKRERKKVKPSTTKEFAKGQEAKEERDKNKKQIKERRKLFKSIGGDKNWKPV